MKTMKHLLFCIVGLFLLNCKGKQGDSGTVGPALSGSIKGRVTLTTSNGTQLSNMSGVTVTTNTGTSAITDTAGIWTLNETTGIYTITFAKTGYGTTTINGYNFSGGGNSYINGVCLSQAPVYTVSTVLDTIGGNSSSTKDLHMNVNLTVTGAVGQIEEMEFFGYYSTSSVVSSSNYMGMINIPVPATQLSFKGSITGADFLSAGIEPGQLVYVVVYPSSSSPTMSSKYVDENTGRNVYTSLGQASPIQSLVVPH
jgi:hypothetical protein